LLERSKMGPVFGCAMFFFVPSLIPLFTPFVSLRGAFPNLCY
jgi:hypothetical protein